MPFYADDLAVELRGNGVAVVELPPVFTAK
jgi:hypothetical protein